MELDAEIKYFLIFSAVLMVVGQLLSRKAWADARKRPSTYKVVERPAEPPKPTTLKRSLDIVFACPTAVLIALWVYAHMGHALDAALMYTLGLNIFLFAGSVFWYGFRYLESKKNPVVYDWRFRLHVVLGPTVLLIFAFLITNWR